jgi:hypothetical protein
LRFQLVGEFLRVGSRLLRIGGEFVELVIDRRERIDRILRALLDQGQVDVP